MIDMYGILFYFFSIAIILSGSLILFTKNTLHAVVSLLIVFLCVGGLLALSNAEFVAVTQIVIYVGGILVLLIFGIMLSNRVGLHKQVLATSGYRVTGTIATVLIAAVLNIVLFRNDVVLKFTKSPVADHTIEIGKSFMTHHILLFELIAIILLVALVGAMVIVVDRKEESQ